MSLTQIRFSQHPKSLPTPAPQKSHASVLLASLQGGQAPKFGCGSHPTFASNLLSPYAPNAGRKLSYKA